MNRKIIKFLFVFSILLIACFTVTTRADQWDDYSNGSSGNLGTLRKGSWSIGTVGLKISIIKYVNSEYKVKDVEIIFNSNPSNDSIFSSDNSPKMLQKTSIYWDKKGSMSASKKAQYSYVSNLLPSEWDPIPNIDNLLTEKNYEVLLALLDYRDSSGKKIFEKDIEPEDYVVVEPMTRINNYYGTAFELANAFYNEKCGEPGSFCYEYAEKIFCNNKSKSCNGIFYKSIYSSDIIGLKECSGTGYKNINKCFKLKNFNHGIGVYKYSNILGSLKITKKDSKSGNVLSGATFSLYRTKAACQSNSTNSTVFVGSDTTNGSGVVTFSKLPLENQTYFYKETKAPSGYILDSTCKSVTIKKGSTTTVTVYNEKNNPTPYLMVTKTDNVGNPISTSKATFGLYGSDLCGADGSSPIRTFQSGDRITLSNTGTYYLQELKAPTGYSVSSECREIHINSGQNTIYFKNKSVCETEFEKNPALSNPNNANYAVYRVNLYNKLLLEENQDFRMLLNFNETRAEYACQSLTPQYTNSTSCLTTINNDATFNHGNVSMYTERVGNFNRTFCLTTYSLSNNLGNNSGFGIVKSGQLITSSKDVLAIGVLKRVCYSYDTTGGSFDNGFNYNSYITSTPILDDKKLESGTPVNSGGNKVSCSSSEFCKQKYEKTIRVDYKLPLLYGSIIDGRVYTYCPSDKYCKVLGRGIETIFNLAPTVKINQDGSTTRLNSSHKMSFIIQIQGNDKKASCDYDIINELITKDNKLELEFRTVTTNSSKDFLDKDGNIRNYGSNWSSEADRTQVLDESNNSYNKKNEEPLYTITLTPSIMSDIRQYNKNNSYSDFNFTCNSDRDICISNYLTNFKDLGLLEIYSTSEKRLCIEQNVCP